MNRFWKYRIQICDYNDYGRTIHRGLVIGKTVAKAVEKLTEEYGEFEKILFLEEFAIGNVLEEADIKEYEEE